MSTVGSALIACNDVQGLLTNYWNTCGHATAYDESPFLQFIYSDLNRMGIEQVIHPERGKIRPVELIYDQKIPTSQVTEVERCGLLCAATTKRGNLSATYEIDPCQLIQVEELIEHQDLVPVCEDNGTFVARKIQAMLLALESKIAEVVAEQAILLLGRWADNVTSQNGTLVGNNAPLILQPFLTGNTGAQSLNPRFLSTLKMALKRTGYCDRAFAFGSSIIWEAWDLLNAGCCADNGVSLFEMMQRYGRDTIMTMDDYVVSAWDGDDRNAIITQPGAMQLLTFTKGTTPGFKPISGPAASNFEVIPVTTPRYGLPADMTVSNNCGALSLILTTTVDLVGAPTDLFPSGDRKEGVTYVNMLQYAAAT